MTENTPGQGAERAVGDAMSGAADEQPAGVSDALKDRVIRKLKTVYDPEIPVDIYELGLIYAVEIQDEDEVLVTMTLTSPHCPVAESLPIEVETKVREVEGVANVDLALVWDPPWDPDMMSEAAKLELNF
jgi:FeS assembly SUF system protein